jgi:mannosylglycerate hydrolase
VTRRVDIVPHTHWDREWYLPFQAFRFRLVGLLDELLERLADDPGYAHFLLDGQMAVVDDYLAVRPEAAATLRAMATSGRVAMGPWYTLPDEFLVTGETLVRDLELGLERAAHFGGAMPVGYLPDMFGHVAQMPQILRLFGFSDAVVWRGVPSSVTRSAFWWRAPDGSTVRAEYLPTGYGNGSALPDDAKELLAAIKEWTDEHRGVLGDDEPILWMNGTDHQTPRPWLGRVVAEANAIDDDLHLVVTSLAEHLRDTNRDGLSTIDGELRSGARANLLMGVTSNRVDVRRAVAVTARALEHLAEPMQALFVPADAWPSRLLDEAWLSVVRNAAHDSVCACSDDEVVDAVLHRYAEARQIADALTIDALRHVGAQLAGDEAVVVNPGARTRSGVVELTVDDDQPRRDVQVVSHEPARQLLHTIDAASAAVVVRREINLAHGLARVDIVEHDDESVHVALVTGATPGITSDRDAIERLQRLGIERPHAPLRVYIEGRPRQRLLARIDDVPGYGWTAAQPAPIGDSGVHADEHSLTSALVTVRVDPRTGTFSIGDQTGLGRLVDGGDAGDTYNYCPPDDDLIVDTPTYVTTSVVEGGPLRARLRIDARYEWPERVDDGGRRIGNRDVAVTTILELRAGSPLVHVDVSFDNQCDDHRLRVHFPLPVAAVRSDAECAFAVVSRGLTAEGGPSEQALATFPSQRFVCAGGLTVVHEGLNEYELIDVVDGRANTLAITLLRASRYLSRGPMTTRTEPAGPEIELHGSQVHGPYRARFAVAIADIDPYVAVDDAFLPLLVTRGAGLGSRPDRHQVLAVDGAEVASVRRVGGQLSVRLFNPRAGASVVTVDRVGWAVDLRGRPIEAIDGSFTMRPGQIATLVLPET